MRKWIHRTVIGTERGVAAFLLRWLILFPCSFLYRFGIGTHRWLHRVGLLSTHQAPLRVISIGNVVAGGSGKTPVTLFLAERLSQMHKVAVLSRGYKAEAEKRGQPTWVDPERGTAAEYGDEPLLIAKRLPHVRVYAGRNRVRSAQLASEDGCTVALLDDGMQHWKLKRDVEVVVVDCAKPFGNGHLLPMGELREGPRALKRADLLVLTNATEDWQQRKVELQRWTDAPCLVTRPRVVSDLELQGKPVALFCGIAHPERVVSTVEKLGAQVCHTLFLEDHEPISRAQLQQFAQEAEAKGAKHILCTEKDWVKLPEVTLALPIDCVQIALELLEEPDLSHTFVEG